MHIIWEQEMKGEYMKSITKIDESLLKNLFVVKENGIQEPFKNFKHTGDSSDDDMGGFGFLLLLALLEEITGHIKQYNDLLENEKFFNDNVCYMLVHKDSEFLNDMPKRKIFDMVLVYYLPIKSMASVSALKVTNEIAKKMGLTENDLYNLARVNTPRLFPLEREKGLFLTESINEKLGKNLFDFDISYSNEMGINGAVSIFYENAFENLDIEDDDQLIIMPISIHGMLVLVTKKNPDMDKEKIVSLLTELNKKCLFTVKLSDTVMYYDKDMKEIMEL